MRKLIIFLCALFTLVTAAGSLSFLTYASGWPPPMAITPEDNPGIEREIQVYTDSKNVSYAFLPKTYEDETVVIRCYENVSEASGDALISFDSAERTLTCRAENGGALTVDGFEIRIMKGCLPVMDIEVGEGHGLYEIHRSKDVKIPVTVGISGTDGGKYDLSASAAEMKTRGYSTFNYPKKPYQIKFDKKIDLFGMGKAKKWILLANYIDGTAIRNKLVFDLGEEIGCVSVSKSVFVDLYVEGQYLGVYQLAEKVEVGSTRVDLKDEYGVLLELDITERLDSSDIYFTTSKTKKAVVYKDYVTDFEDTSDPENKVKVGEIKSYVKSYINEFEGRLYSNNSKWEDIARMIDVDSFVRYFFITEFSEEVDATFASTFFYMDGRDDVLHCDPLWDYDRCFGLETGYEDRYNADFLKSITVSTDNYRVEWFKQLFRYDEFVRRVNEMYEETVKDVFKADRVNAKVDEYQSAIWDSLMMNYARWKHVYCGAEKTANVLYPDYDSADLVEYCTDYMKDWIADRSAFLERAYGTDIPIIRYSVASQNGSFGSSYTGGFTERDINVNSLNLRIDESDVDGGIKYSTMYAGRVFGPASDGEDLVATYDRLTGVSIELTGNIANYYSVQYCIKKPDGKTTSWFSDGQIAGSKSGSFSIYGVKALSIRLVRKKLPEYTSVTAHVPGGTVEYSGIVGNRAALPRASVQDYRFEGWYDNADFEGEELSEFIWGELDEVYAKMTYVPFARGDANLDGRVTMKDVLLLRRYLAGLEEVENVDLRRADMNADGAVTMKDVLALRRFLSGIPPLALIK